MKNIWFILLLSMLLSPGCGEAPPPMPPPPQPVTTGQYVKLGMQNGQAVRYANTSAYYQKALNSAQRAVTAEEILRLNARRSVTVKIANGLPAQLGDDVARIVSSASLKPNRNTIIAGLASAGLITAVYLLDDEEEEEAQQQVLPIGSPLSDKELNAKLSRFNGLVAMPDGAALKPQPAPQPETAGKDQKRQTFDLLMKKVPANPSISASMQVAGVRRLNHPITQVPGAEIAIAIELPASNELSWFSVYLSHQDGRPLQPKSEANRDPKTGQFVVRNFLIGTGSKRSFTAEAPYRIFLPYAAADGLQAGQSYQCRIVYHGSDLDAALGIKKGTLNL